MAAVTGRVNLEAMSHSIAILLREMGEHEPDLASMCAELNENKTLDQIGEKRFSAFHERLLQFGRTESNWRRLKEEIEASNEPDSEALQVWRHQLAFIAPHMKECRTLWKGNLRRNIGPR